ncbi:MAG: hypothetical protein QGG40_18365 [Myxococcota bacterium]|jgi:hypothetical protein|nr:hypothetical protein [Myxococcota bacterium]
MSVRPSGWARAALAGWIAVWLLFVVFHGLFFANRIEALLWVTLLSVGPIWVLTALGGMVELRGVWARFRDTGER